MKSEILELEDGRQYLVTIDRKLTGAWVSAKRIVNNPLRRLTSFTPVRWIAAGEESVFINQIGSITSNERGKQ